MSQSKKTMLFLARKAPYSSSTPAAGLDILLTAAAFDQDVTLVFSDDGVYQLLKEQNSEELGLKNIAKSFPALALYEVNKVLVDQDSLRVRRLTLKDLAIDVEEIDTQSLGELLESVDEVFNF